MKRIERVLFSLPLIFLLAAARSFAQTPRVLFYAPFEGGTTGYSTNYAFPETFMGAFRPWGLGFGKGLIGQAVQLKPAAFDQGLRYPINQLFDPARGTLSLWLKFPSDSASLVMPADKKNSLALAGLQDKRVKDILQDRQWHHFVYTWDLAGRSRKQYLDGKLLAAGAYPAAFQFNTIAFLAGYTKLPTAYGQEELTGDYPADNWLDELVLLDQPLGESAVAAAHESYRKGLQPFAPLPAGRKPFLPLDLATAAAGRPTRPGAVDWKLGEPAFRNGQRTQYRLGGYWRIQPAEFGQAAPLENDWLYLPVPGRWLPKPARPLLLNQDFKPVADYKGKELAEYAGFFLEREFTPPAGWQGKQVRLRVAGSHINSQSDFTDVYLNGNHLGTILFQWHVFPGDRWFDLTGRLQPDRPNRITLVQGLRGPKVSDAALLAEPVLEVIETNLVELDQLELVTIPRVSEGKLKIRLPAVNRSGRSLALGLKARIYDREGKTAVTELGPVALTLAKGFRGEMEASFPARTLKTWTPESPNLYQLVLEVSQSDKVIDQLPPVRFGYREIRVEKGEILINGIPLMVNGKSHGGLPFRKGEIEIMKATGQNADRTMPDDIFRTVRMGPDAIETLNVADEEGWLALIHVEGLSKGYPDDWTYCREWMEQYPKLVANHPSAVIWQVWSGGYQPGPHGHPMSIGAVVPEEIVKNEWHYRRNRFLKEFDPERRPFYYYTGGTGAEIRAIMMSLGYGTPIQEMEEWLSYWAAHKIDPFLPVEQQIFSRPDYFWQRGSKESIVLEYYAKFFGEAAYRKATADLVTRWQDNKGNQWATPEYWTDFYNLAYTRAIRSWRTYGINGYLFHVSFFFPALYEKGRLGGPLTPFGENISRVNAPVLFYLAGPPEDFVSKDHNYFGGEKARKSGVLINQTFHPLAGRISWRLEAADRRELAAGSAAVTVEPGRTHFQPLDFDLPAVREKTPLRITARFEETGSDTVRSDTFRLTIFPARETAAPGKPVALIDETGETAEVLQKLGVPCQLFNAETITAGRTSFQDHQLLVIGKNSYPAAVKIFTENIPFVRQVGEGLNVLVLEQANRNLAGLSVENFASRQAFIRDRASPLLEGLEDEDFSDWRGESRRLPAYQAWNPKSKWNDNPQIPSKYGHNNSFGQGRFWHWTNKGLVATFTFEKPQLGNFRVLLDHEFDLLYTPLVEFRQGKGRLIFSQLDLVDHFENEPVAALLMARLLRELNRPAGSGLSPAGLAGNGPERNRLEELKVEYREGLAGPVVWLAPEAATDPAALARYLDEGGTILVALRDQAAADRLPVRVTVEKKPYFKAEIPADPVFAGLSRSDFYFRKLVEMPQVTAVNGRPAENGTLGVIPVGRGRLVYLQLFPETWSDPWQQGKCRRAFSTVLNNLGAASRVAPDFKLIGGYGLVNEWLAGYQTEVPGLESRPMVKESPLYPRPALDFDPAAHYVW